MSEPRWVPVGKIIRTHGVRGAVKIYPYGETLATLKTGSRLHRHRPEAPALALTVKRIRWQGRHCLMDFEEFDSLDGVQVLLGEEVFLPENLLPPTGENEYYHYQLLGLTVETGSGVVLGTIKGILSTASHDIYLVKQHGKEMMIPAVADVVRSVDLDSGRMRVELPEGLIDDL
jgi:16S rRNA processing protein RimM